jgi:hypothetical protein
MTNDKSRNDKPINGGLNSELNTSNVTQDSLTAKPSLVPKAFTVGLAVFSLVLSLSGYVFRYITGDSISAILRHAAVLVPAFVIGVPLAFWIGALIMNKVKGMHIQRRNAFTLGWLISCVTMLWLMGTYS